MLYCIFPRGVSWTGHFKAAISSRTARRAIPGQHVTRRPLFTKQLRHLSSKSSARKYGVSEVPGSAIQASGSLPRDNAAEVETSLDTKLDHYPAWTNPIQSSLTATSPNAIHQLSPMLASYPAPSPNHHNLSTFLTHANRTGLNPASTTYRGTLYEYITQSALHRYGMSLLRVGGRNDGGVDMVGTWSLPNSTSSSLRPHDSSSASLHTADETILDPNPAPSLSSATAPPIRVAIQCKRFAPSSKSSLGPSLVRELEGAIRRRHSGLADAGGLMGILVSTRPATKGLREALRDCRLPMGWICLEIGGRPARRGSQPYSPTDALERGCRFARTAGGR